MAGDLGNLSGHAAPLGDLPMAARMSAMVVSRTAAALSRTSSRQLAAIGNDVDHAMWHRKLADAADQSGPRCSDLLDGKNDFRCCCGGVMPKRHRDSARMPGDTVNGHAETYRSGDEVTIDRQVGRNRIGPCSM